MSVSEDLDLAQTLLDKEDHEEALFAFTQILEQEEDHIEARYGLAEAHALAGQTDEAVRAFEAALGLERRGRGLANLSEVLLGRGDEGSAVTPLLEEAIELDPDDSKAYVLLADLATRDGEFERADSLLRKGIRRGAELPDGHIFVFYQRWIGALVEGDKSAAAAEVAAAAVAFHRGGKHLLILAGGAAEAAGDSAAAIQHYKAALPYLEGGQLRLDILEKIAALV